GGVPAACAPAGGGGGGRGLGDPARGWARGGPPVPARGRAPARAPAGSYECEGVRVVLFGAGRRTTLEFVRGAVFAARRAARELLAHSTFDVIDVHQPLAGYGVLGLPAARRLPMPFTFLSPPPPYLPSRQPIHHHHVPL